MRTESEIKTALSIEKAVSEGAIRALEAEKKEYAEEQALYQKHEIAKEKELDDYIATNPVAIQRRTLEQKKNSVDKVFMWWLFAVIAEIGLVITCLFISNWWLCALPVIFVVLAILNKRKVKDLQWQIEELSFPLKEFDVYKNELELNRDHYRELRMDLHKKIDANEQKIRKLKANIDAAEKKVELELKYAPFAKGYLLVCVMEKRPDYMRAISHEIVIDGVGYGMAQLPFKPIKLEPGMHTVRVYVNDLGDVYSSNVDQIHFSGDSCFLFYKYNGSIHPFSGQLYGEIDEFFKATQQKPI